MKAAIEWIRVRSESPPWQAIQTASAVAKTGSTAEKEQAGICSAAEHRVCCQNGCLSGCGEETGVREEAGGITRMADKRATRQPCLWPWWLAGGCRERGPAL